VKRGRIASGRFEGERGEVVTKVPSFQNFVELLERLGPQPVAIPSIAQNID
jgi:hypothetical protein